MILNSPYISGSITVTGNATIQGTISGSVSGTASNATTASYAATASSADNLLVRNTLTAQTLVVQTITSSVDFVTGSTRFGSIIGNTHVFTGSLLLNGSSSIQSVPNGIGEYYYLSAKGSYSAGLSIYEYSGVQYINASSSMFLRYNNLGGTTGVFAIVSGSSEVLRITAAGNVNIGRTDDSYKFSISSGFPKTETNGKGLIFFGSNEAITSNPFGLVITVTGAASIANRYVTLGTTDFGLANGGNLILQSTGNVGIGLNGPGYKLDVYRGSSGVVLNLQGIDAYSAETGILFSSARAKISGFLEAGGGTPGAYLSLHTQPTDGSLTERMRITSDGDAGIGTTSIYYASTNRRVLEINGAATSFLAFKTGDVAKSYLFQTGTNFIITNLAAAGGDLILENGGAQRMKIDGGGNFDYGGYAVLSTNNPTYRQAFWGGLSIMWRGAHDCYINSNHTYSSSNTNVASYTTTTGIGRFDISGGNITYNTYNGSVTAGGAYALTSVFAIAKAGYTYLGNGHGNTNHRINLTVAQSSPVLVVSGYSTVNNDTAIFFAVGGASGNAAACAINVSNNTATNRSINAGGSINASGLDYAEYMEKAVEDIINKGDIVGVNSQGKLTNMFNDAISFVVKSTDPAYIGGDTWGAVSSLNKPTSLYTEEELQQYKVANEAARVIVDRIAFSGQVPCNITGANVGDYIIPIQLENGKIGGQAITYPTFEQYQISVGKVWKVLDDGRAWIAVKIG